MKNGDISPSSYSYEYENESSLSVYNSSPSEGKTNYSSTSENSVESFITSNEEEGYY